VVNPINPVDLLHVRADLK